MGMGVWEHSDFGISEMLRYMGVTISRYLSILTKYPVYLCEKDIFRYLNILVLEGYSRQCSVL